MTFTIHHGDCLDVLRGLPPASVHCCVTSPPYFGLRDYGHPGQIGLEGSPDAYVDKLVEVFREVRRVLRDDGTLWLNLGDTYASDGGPGWQGKNGERADRRFTGTRNTVPMREQARTAFKCMKPKDLIGIPWMVAFALRADGWFLRQDIIWSKPNPMPESVKDRCTKAHEYIFMFSKSERYFYDQVAIAEPIAATTVDRFNQPNLENQTGSRRIAGREDRPMKAVLKKQDGHGRRHDGFNDRYFGADGVAETRNKRSVWTVSTKPFKDAHFATFPTDLIEPCIKAGSPSRGTILDPFGGAGTTGLVAERLGRDSILIEVNPEYVEMATRRIIADAPLLTVGGT